MFLRLILVYDVLINVNNHCHNYKCFNIKVKLCINKDILNKYIFANTLGHLLYYLTQGLRLVSLQLHLKLHLNIQFVLLILTYVLSV